MSEILHRVIETEILPHVKEWQSPEQGDDLYGPDQVIEAFNAGVAKGAERERHLIREQGKRNLDTVTAATKDLVIRMRERGIEPMFARLRFADWDMMQVMFAIQETDWLKPEAEDLLNDAATIESSVCNEVLDFSFRFVGVGETFNEELVQADGYVYPYTPLL